MTDEHFNDLLAAYLDGDISDCELAELHEAVHDSDRYRRRFQEDSRLHVLMRETLVEEVELQTFKEGLPVRRGSDSRSRRVLLAAVAMIAVCAVLAVTWVRLHRQDDHAALGNCLSVSGDGRVQIERVGERLCAVPDSVLHVGDRVVCDSRTQAMLRFVDGSIVSMEPESRLVLVSEQPLVKLEHGEALFEIAQRDDGMTAFEVLTGQSTVEVTGTVFALEANGHTQVRVYEGTVIFTRHEDKASVEVASEQMATTSADTLIAEDLSQSASSSPLSVMSLLPSDDATLQRGQCYNGRHLMVEAEHRTAYLRFEIPPVGTICSARLRLTQDVDTGSGTLRFFACDRVDWTEENLSGQRVSGTARELAQRIGVVQRREVVEVDVTNAISGPGAITIMVTLDKSKEHDVWFGSRESDVPPQLILAYRQSPEIR